MAIYKAGPDETKKHSGKTGLFGCLFFALVLFVSQNAAARETITVQDCDTCMYTVVAYNTSSRTYYNLQGVLTGNPDRIQVPHGYASLLNLTKGRRVGTRNLYEHRDRLNPIYKAVNQSAYVLGIDYVGYKPSHQSQGGTRQPPP